MDSLANERTLTSTQTDRLVQAINRVTDAIAWLFCRFVLGRVLVEAMTRSVVKYAWVHMQTTEPESDRARKSSYTRLALYTGLDSRTIRRILSEPMRATEEHLCAEAAILAAWAKDPALRDPKTGRPGDIPLFGGVGTFEGLVHLHVGRGVSARYVLDRLIKYGNVEQVGPHFVRLLTADWHLFETGVDEMLNVASMSLLNLTKPMLNNISNKDKQASKWTERCNFSYLVHKTKVSELRLALNAHLHMCWKAAGEIIDKYEVSLDSSPEDLEEVGVGFYYWEGGHPAMPDNTNPSNLPRTQSPWRNEFRSTPPDLKLFD